MHGPSLPGRRMKKERPAPHQSGARQPDSLPCGRSALVFNGALMGRLEAAPLAAKKKLPEFTPSQQMEGETSAGLTRYCYVCC